MYQLFMTGEGGVGGRIVGFVFRGDNAGAGWAGWCSGEIMHVVFRGIMQSGTERSHHCCPLRGCCASEVDQTVRDL